MSFVISLQNRWASFDDPDRWLFRFGEDLEHYRASPHFVYRTNWERYKILITQNIIHTQEPGLTYPDYWDDTDYMQHRIIGPVVLTVHQAPTLQPGTYSQVPRISHWEAPSHVLTDDQVQCISRGEAAFREHRDIFLEDRTARVFEVWRYLRRPNTGFPLPGHVMVTSQYGPGTKMWEKYEMESWEKYDRSLAEP